MACGRESETKDEEGEKADKSEVKKQVEVIRTQKRKCECVRVCVSVCGVCECV